MKYTVAAILSLGVVPAYSLSYLESLSGAKAPSMSSAAPVAEPPFFFTNGAKDEPAETPDFFFTNGSVDSHAMNGAPLPPAASTSTGYLSALKTNSVSGAGMASYLDALPKNAAPSFAGAGIASYLDSLPKNSVRTTGGSGLASYTDMLNAPATYTPVAAAQPERAAPAPVATEPSVPIVSGNYLDVLAKSTSSGAPTGAGMTSYLDALPRAAVTAGGAGIHSYKDSLPVTNTSVGTGAGMSTYTDNLSGGRASAGKSFSPFSAKGAAPATAFGMGTTAGKFDFSIQANADMIAQIEAAGGRRVRLSGKARFN